MIGNKVLKDNERILTHWNEGLEIVLVTEGTLSCLINGAQFALTVGDICIINQDALHKMSCFEHVEFTSIDLNRHTPGITSDLYDLFVQPIVKDIGCSQIILKGISQEGRDIRELLTEFKNNGCDNDESGVLLEASLSYQLLYRVYNVYKGLQGRPKKPLDEDALLFQRMVEFIYDSYHLNIQVDAIAKAGMVGRNKCFALFKKFAHETPKDFLNAYRLEIATHLLVETSMPVSEVAQACGFNQQSYFGALFLKTYTQSPRAYRLSHAQSG